MRILYFSRDYGSYTTTFIRNQVGYFADKHDCLYLCQQSVLKEQRPDFLQVIPFTNNPLRKLLWKSGWRANFYSPAYSKKITRIIEDFNPDIIHCHFAVEALMLIDNIDYKKYPVLIHFHGYDASQAIRNPAFVRRLKYLLNQPGITPVSCNQYFANRLAGILKVQVNNFFILRYGIDISLFNRKEPRSASDEKTFLQISSFSIKKGHQYTLRAFSIFLKTTDHKNCRLVIAGEGPEKHKAEKLANKLGIQNNVHFTGIVTPGEAINLLQQADIFVHHSVTAPNGDMEGIPNSIIEAMAMELPVISTYHSGIPELVKDKINGYLVKEKDIYNYSQKMEMALAMNLLKENREKVDEFYEMNKQNEKLERLYKQLIR